MVSEISEPYEGINKTRSSRPLRVAYFLHRFPYLTETFIMREMYWLQQQNIELTIFSLLRPIHKIVHPQARELQPLVVYDAPLSLKVTAAQFYFLFHSPWRYARSFIKTIWQTYLNPTLLIRAMILFPLNVYIARVCHDRQIEHIHAHFVWLEGIAAGVVNELTGIPFSTHPHAHGLFGRNQRNVRNQLSNANKIIGISEFHRSYIHKLCPQVARQNIPLVHCGIEPERLQPGDVRRDNHPARLLFVGRLIEKKGLEYLIDACAVLRDRGVEFRCQIVGDGPLRSVCQYQIEQRDLSDLLVMLGALDQPAIFELYDRSDIFVLPCVVSRSGDRDGIPVVLMEAMAYRLPVITTPVTGIPDLVEHDRTGLLVPERDSAKLATTIERLINDRQFCHYLGEEGRRRVIDDFNIHKSVRTMLSVFRTVVRQESRR